jgi:CheY-like chemotaxis protein
MPRLTAGPFRYMNPADSYLDVSLHNARVPVKQAAATSLATVLTLLGNEVQTAQDGVEPLAAAGEFRPELILMDPGMPRLNGYETIRRIRKQPWARSVTIIALTGWGPDGDRLESSEARCDGHLVKPVALHELEKLLVNLTATSTEHAQGTESET